MDKNAELQALILKLAENEKLELIEFLDIYLKDKKKYMSTRNYFLVNPSLIDEL